MPPAVSVIVPVLGQGEGINALVDHIRVVGYGTAVEIVVVDGDPAGATLAALDRRGVVCLCAPPGPASQQNAGARAASGEVFLFLAPGTRLPAGAFQAMAGVLAGPDEAGAFSLAVRSGGLVLRLVAAGANLRSRLLGLPGAAQALFFRRELFFALGGFPDRPGLESLAMACLARRLGAGIAILPDTVSVSDRRWREGGLWRTMGRDARLLCRLVRGAGSGRLPSPAARGSRPGD